MKKFIKKHLHKIISVFCAVLIALTTAVCSFPVYASVDAPMPEISFNEAIYYLSEVTTLPKYELLNAYEWKCEPDRIIVTGKYCSLEYEIFKTIDTNEITHFLWSGTDLIYPPGHSETYEPVSASSSAPVLSGSDYKAIVEDYKSRYAPMPTPSQYVYSVRNNDLTIKKDNNYYLFEPFTPVYRYTSGQWGGKGWNSVYILPFVYDDNEGKGYYYYKYFYHFYSTKDDNNVIWFHSDSYKLMDGSLVKSDSFEWDFAKYPVLGFKHFVTQWFVYAYSSDFNYISNVTGTNNRISLCTYNNSDFYSTSSVTMKCTDLVKSSGTLNMETNPADDMGAILSETPFELYANQTSIDFTKIPDNYNITIQGDTIYNYPISDPDTGKSTTINNYITNNYTIPDEPDTPDNPDNPGGGGGSVSGDITVGGNVSVGGQIEIKADPIEINLNVSGGSSGTETGDVVSPDISDTVNYLPENTETMKNYFSVFFDFLPPEMLALLLGGIACAILCRALGR